MWKAMVRHLHVFVMHTVTTEIAGVNAMQNCLLNTCVLCVMKEMTRKTRAREAMPKAVRLVGMGAL